MIIERMSNILGSQLQSSKDEADFSITNKNHKNKVILTQANLNDKNVLRLYKKILTLTKEKSPLAINEFIVESCVLNNPKSFIQLVAKFIKEFESKYIEPCQELMDSIMLTNLVFFEHYMCERIYWKYLCYGMLSALENLHLKINSLCLISDNDNINYISDFNQLRLYFMAKVASFYDKTMNVIKQHYNFNYSQYVFDFNHLSYKFFGNLQGKNNDYKSSESIIITNLIKNNTTNLPLLSLFYWICIARGDLTRYMNTLVMKNSIPQKFLTYFVHPSTFWYTTAIQLDPSKSQGYNQMSIVTSAKNNRPFDLLYYLMRSYVTANGEDGTESFHYQFLSLFEQNHKTYMLAKNCEGDVFVKKLDMQKLFVKLLEPMAREELLNKVLVKNKTELWIRKEDDENVFIPNYKGGLQNNIKVDHDPYLLILQKSVSEQEANSTLLFDSSGAQSPSQNRKNLIIAQQISPNYAEKYAISTKYFILYYINLHGKLYNRVNLDDFDRILGYMKCHFDFLLDTLFTEDFTNSLEHNDGLTNNTSKNFHPNAFLTDPQRILQILAMNLFSLDRYLSKIKLNSEPEQQIYRVPLEKSFALMFTITNSLLKSFIVTFCQIDMRTALNLNQNMAFILILPYLNTFLDWLIHLPLDVLSKCCVLPNVTELLELLGKLSQLLPTLLNASPSFFDNLALYENWFFSGYPPLYNSSILNSEVEAVRHALPTDNLAEYIFLGTRKRVEKIMDNLSILQNNPDFQLKSNVNNQTAPIQQAKESNRLILDELYAKLQMLGHKHTIIEIRPRYLVFDTNCMIDHLDPLKTIIMTPKNSESGNGLYIVLIPLVVIGELQKLAKFDYQPTCDSEDVAVELNPREKSARLALDFVKSYLTRPHSKNLYVLTGQGNLAAQFLDSSNEELSSFYNQSSGSNEKINQKIITFSNGQNSINLSPMSRNFNNVKGDKVSHSTKNNITTTPSKFSFKKGLSTHNDDLILASCNKFIRKQQKLTAIPSEYNLTNRDVDFKYDKRFLTIIQRNLVFFTDDQNLKIKSHMMFVPTVPVKEFMAWAGLT